MDKLGELKNQLYNFMRNLSHENPTTEKLDRMIKLMGQMEDVLYEIKKPSIDELRRDTSNIIARMRSEAEVETEPEQEEDDSEELLEAEG